MPPLAPELANTGYGATGVPAAPFPAVTPPVGVETGLGAGLGVDTPPEAPEAPLPAVVPSAIANGAADNAAAAIPAATIAVRINFLFFLWRIGQFSFADFRPTSCLGCGSHVWCRCGCRWRFRRCLCQCLRWFSIHNLGHVNIGGCCNTTKPDPEPDHDGANPDQS